MKIIITNQMKKKEIKKLKKKAKKIYKSTMDIKFSINTDDILTNIEKERIEDLILLYASKILSDGSYKKSLELMINESLEVEDYETAEILKQLISNKNK